MLHVDILDNGSAFCITANGIIVHTENSLGGAWEHIQWMYEVASQEFLVGKNKLPVREWLKQMMKLGYLDTKHYSWLEV